MCKLRFAIILPEMSLYLILHYVITKLTFLITHLENFLNQRLSTT
nr:MAG TPA: hypothetical protein [Caudoviricetes sp.]